MIVVDGNSSLKRICGIGDRVVSDRCVYEQSDYFLPAEFVNQYADEVKTKKPTPDSIDEDADADTEFDNDCGDPTDGDPSPSTVAGCAKNWKATEADKRNKSWVAFDENGLFAGACRHALILWVIDMIRSGEL